MIVFYWKIIMNIALYLNFAMKSNIFFVFISFTVMQCYCNITKFNKTIELGLPVAKLAEHRFLRYKNGVS